MGPYAKERMAAGDDRSVLRAKYHDWCSARVADRFVELSPEQIYALAHGSTGGGALVEAGASGGENASAASDVAGASSFDELSYPELVARVTEALARELGLPPYEEWVERYRSDPRPYDEEMLGFWRRTRREREEPSAQ